MRLSNLRTALVHSVFALLLLTGCQSTARDRIIVPAVTGSTAGGTNLAVEVSTDDVNINSAPLSLAEGWMLKPLSNESVTSVAPDIASSLLETHLRLRGVPFGLDSKRKARYAIGGIIGQWHYKGNVSGRPRVSMRLNVTDLSTKKIVWSDAFMATGARRDTLSGLADQVIATLSAKIPLTQQSETVDSNMMFASTDAIPPSNQGEPMLRAANAAGLRVAASEQETHYFLNTAIETEKSLQGRSTAFYYGANPAVDVLSQFDRLVVEADNITSAELDSLQANGTHIYAYLSVGEIGPERSYVNSIDPAWVLGTNESWNSKVLDLSKPAVRKFLLQQVSDLRGKGYRGLFLDTMDSFTLYAKTDAQIAEQSAGLTSLINTMASHYPELRMIANRGFEVLDAVSEHMEAVAAESMYAGWNNATQMYIEVPAGDRQWLRTKLDYAKNTLGLDVIVIDYLPPNQRLTARSIAEKIAQDGYIPWVANPSLDYIGVGALEVIPRKVLMLYNSDVDGPLEQSYVHKFAAMPLEYMGFVPEYLDLARESLPAAQLKGRYAGIVSWPLRSYALPGLASWLEKQITHHVPVALLGAPPVALSDSLQEAMGIELVGGFDSASAVVATRDRLIQPEKSLSRRINNVSLVARSKHAGNTVHFSYTDKSRRRADVVVTGNFGGFAWAPAVMQDGLDYETHWVVEPFEFLRKALRLPNVPMPDVTTENGKRIWLAHIDGDALPSWAEMPGKRLGADVIYDEILKPYALPHTVSIVEGEMTELDAYADRRERMFSTIRKTFALDNVELASHTYSHPFNWSAVTKHPLPGRYNLDVKGYRYSPERETQGSIAFIDSELAPAGKRTQLMLWSGNALPGELEMAVLADMDMPNMNGGMTVATNARQSMSLVSPMARPIGNYVQVYAPIMNENVYTNDWRGPFDGFKRVVETLKITDNPRRIKPINIYYHFYTGTKIAAMKALRDVYDWSIDQDIFPVYGSAFARKVPDHRQVGVARYLSGEWKVSRLGHVRSLRVLDADTFPVLMHSQGLVGARRLHDGVYIHTSGADSVRFSTSRQRPYGVHLVSSNGRIEHWQKTANGLTLRVAGEVPVVVELGGVRLNNCAIHAGGIAVRGVATAAQTTLFRFTEKDTGNAILHCPA